MSATWLNPSRIAWAARMLLAGRLYYGDGESERADRSDVWAIVRPRLPLRYLRVAECGLCHASPIRRSRIAYFNFDCIEHMGDLRGAA